MCITSEVSSMSFRDKLKKVKPTDVDIDLGELLNVNIDKQWFTGIDVPITWDTKYLRLCHKNTLRWNFKRGYFNKTQYKQALKEL